MLQNPSWRQWDHQHRKLGDLNSKWVKGIQEPYREKQNKTKKPLLSRKLRMTKTFCFHLHSGSSEMGSRSKAVGGWFFIPLCCKKKFSEHFVRKKSLTQETRINRDCNNPCYKWDGPSLPPSCIIGNPPREAFWTKRFSRAWCTNHVTKITGSCLQCSVNIFYRRPENFQAWSRTESPGARLSCSSPGLAAGPILTQPEAQGDITC